MGSTVPADLAEALSWTGVAWPAIDADALDRLADAYNNYASEVDTARMDADAAATDVMGDNSGPAADAFASYWGQVSGSHLVAVFNASKKLVTGFRDSATEVRNAQNEAGEQLRTLRDKITMLRAEGRLPPDRPIGDTYEVSSARTALTSRFDAMAAKVAGLLRTAHDLGGLEGLTHESTRLNESDMEPAPPASPPATDPAGSGGPTMAPQSKITSVLNPNGDR
ncbi:WXG100-like domain-containing protein [Embleya sp. NPDC055664]